MLSNRIYLLFGVFVWVTCPGIYIAQLLCTRLKARVITIALGMLSSACAVDFTADLGKDFEYKPHPNISRTPTLMFVKSSISRGLYSEKYGSNKRILTAQNIYYIQHSYNYTSIHSQKIHNTQLSYKDTYNYSQQNILHTAQLQTHLHSKPKNI